MTRKTRQERELEELQLAKQAEAEFRATLGQKLFELIATAQAEGLETKVTHQFIDIIDTQADDYAWDKKFELSVNTISAYHLQQAFEFVENKRAARLIAEQQAALLQTAKDKIRQALTAEELAAFKAYCENTSDIYL